MSCRHCSSCCTLCSRLRFFTSYLSSSSLCNWKKGVESRAGSARYDDRGAGKQDAAGDLDELKLVLLVAFAPRVHDVQLDLVPPLEQLVDLLLVLLLARTT